MFTLLLEIMKIIGYRIKYSALFSRVEDRLVVFFFVDYTAVGGIMPTLISPIVRLAVEN